MPMSTLYRMSNADPILDDKCRFCIECVCRLDIGSQCRLYIGSQYRLNIKCQCISGVKYRLDIEDQYGFGIDNNPISDADVEPTFCRYRTYHQTT